MCISKHKYMIRISIHFMVRYINIYTFSITQNGRRYINLLGNAIVLMYIHYATGKILLLKNIFTFFPFSSIYIFFTCHWLLYTNGAFGLRKRCTCLTNHHPTINSADSHLYRPGLSKENVQYFTKFIHEHKIFASCFANKNPD